MPDGIPDPAFPMARAADPSDKNGHRPTIHLPSGKKYKGEWSANKMHGARPLPPRRGIRFANAHRLTSRFPRHHLAPHPSSTHAGRGEMTYVNGDVYEGDWVENAREGHGTSTRASSMPYHGGTVASGVNPKTSMPLSFFDLTSSATSSCMGMLVGPYGYADSIISGGTSLGLSGSAYDVNVRTRTTHGAEPAR